jgi:hypothetical protein
MAHSWVIPWNPLPLPLITTLPAPKWSDQACKKVQDPSLGLTYPFGSIRPIPFLPLIQDSVRCNRNPSAIRLKKESKRRNCCFPHTKSSKISTIIHLPTIDLHWKTLRKKNSFLLFKATLQYRNLSKVLQFITMHKAQDIKAYRSQSTITHIALSHKLTRIQGTSSCKGLTRSGQIHN